jgi:Spy/CpxP family protein refolding chaperone
MKTIKLALMMMLGILFFNASFAQKVDVSRDLKNPTRRPFLVDDGFNRRNAERTKSDDAKEHKFTDEQRKQMKEIRTEGMKKTLPLQNQLNEKKARLRTLETVDKSDMSEINKTIDEITKIKASIMKIKAENKQKIRALLTDEQKLHFDLTRHERNKRRHKK